MTFDVSVVIPTFNRAALLDETLTWILSQSHQPAEVIVVDDGSTDDTEIVVGRYNSRVRYHHIENSGQARARNVGVSLSTAPWLAFCDDDDLWRPGYLASYARLFNSKLRIEYAFCNFVHVKDGTWEHQSKFDMAPPGFWDTPKQVLDFPAWIFTEPLYDHIIRFQPIFPSAVMLSRDFFERIGGFNEAFSRTVGEDFEFTLRCVQEAPIGYLRQPLVGIRKHELNFSGNKLSDLLGNIEILHHAQRYHDHARYCSDVLEDEIIACSGAAAELAFAEKNLELVQQICQSMPRQDSVKLKIKCRISRLPRRLGRLANLWALVLSDILSKFKINK